MLCSAGFLTMRRPFESVEITSFRGLRGLRLDGLGRVNILVGGTNSGKTSALEALAIFQDPLDPLTWVHVANQREPSPLAAQMTSAVDRVAVLFESMDGDSAGRVQVSATGRTMFKAYSATISKLLAMRPGYEFVEDDAGGLSEVRSDVERRGLRVDVAVENDQRQLFADKSPFYIWERESVQRRPTRFGRMPIRTVTPYDHWLRPNLTKEFTEAVLAGEDHDAIALLRKCDPRIVKAHILTQQQEPMLWLQDSRGLNLPITSFGDGMRRVLKLALEISRTSSSVLMVDEIETGIHVSMLQDVFRWIVEACNRRDIQLFVTTHSLEAIDAILAADTTQEDDTICYHFERTAEGGKVRRHSEDQLRRLRYERGLDLR
jgi:hypothetical protein